MKTENISTTDLRHALAAVNAKFDNNITLTVDGDRFTLGTVDSSGPGGRLGKPLRSGIRRVLPHKACWHVHGHFFDALLRSAPRGVIRTPFGRIDEKGGNWVDARVVGDTALFSELCNCQHAKRKKVVLVRAPTRERLRPRGIMGKILG